MRTRNRRRTCRLAVHLGFACLVAAAVNGEPPASGSAVASPEPPLASAASPAPTPSAPATLPAPVDGIPIGWCIRVKGTTLEEAKAAGFEYVEFALQDVLSLPDEEFERLVERVKTLGVTVRSGYNLVPNDLEVVGPEVDTARQDEHLRRALARLARLGASYAILNNGKSRQVPEGFPREQAFAQLVDFTRRASEEAARNGVTLLIEPLRPSDTNLVNTVADALALVRAVNHPRFEMMVDYSFLMLQNDDPKALLEAGAHLKHVHIANPNGRVYPMGVDESDYATFFRVLAEIGYRGGLSVHAGTNAFAADAPRAIAFLRSMGAGLASSKPKPSHADPKHPRH